ncbi:HAD-like domain-containing protein [Tricharina praecox]|uniref:HAD-like domain-containing protein n=1 Tax=Tricharina praecox TaxID=43433 RepID=UPI00221F58D8|nr:HAD-like domain-containing protein [Tricharina praecox]KAI5852328.1 HAD-like domain-containing protein [Tricharina praecox]
MTIPEHPLPNAADIKMIVSDVDGTLLDSHHALPTTSPTYQVLRRIRAEFPDLPIIISTGKQHRSTSELRSQLQLEGVFPSCHLNGNVLYDASGTVIAESGLDVEVVLRVIKEMRELGTSTFVYDHATVYQLGYARGEWGVGGEEGDGEEGCQWARILRGYGEDVVCVPPHEVDAALDRIRNGELRVVKMAVCQEPETIDIPKTHLLSTFPPTAFAPTQALPFCCELIPAAHNKGTALMQCLKYMNGRGYDIARENVITFGDGENDVSMFRVAGMSVAMGNAMEAARKEARYQTTSNDDGGVGRFLERVFWG